MEHRWGERVSLDCSARIVLQDGKSIDGLLRNASISGALVDTAARLPPYATVSVAISAGTETRRRNLELPACVVRTTPEGIAVEWRDMAVPALISLLREFGGDHPRLCTRDHVFG